MMLMAVRLGQTKMADPPEDVSGSPTYTVGLTVPIDAAAKIALYLALTTIIILLHEIGIVDSPFMIRLQ